MAQRASRNIGLDDDIELHELQRLQKRVEMFQSENKILESELAMYKNSNAGGSSSTAQELQDNMSRELQQTKVQVAKFAQKYGVINRHLSLERAALEEVRRELSKGHANIQQEVLRNLKQLSGACIKFQREAHVFRDESQANKTLLEEFRETSKVQEQTLTATINELKQNEQKQADKYMDACNKSSEWNKREKCYIEEIDKLKELLAKKKSKSMVLFETNNELRQQIEANEVQTKALVETNSNLRAELETSASKLIEVENRWSTENRLVAECKSLLERDLKAEQSVTAALRADLTELQSSLGNSSGRLQSLETENSAQKNDIARLQEKISASIEKQERYMSLNDKLQSDLNSILAREQMLRQEIGSSNLDKAEVQRRLVSIGDKLQTIESEHAAEMQDVNSQLEATQKELIVANAALEKHKDKSGESLQKVKEAEMKYLALVAENLANKKLAEQLEAGAKDATTRAEKAERDIALANTAIDELRNDRDDALERADGIKSENVALKAQVAKLEKDIDILSRKLKDQPSPTATAQLRDALALANKQLADKEEDIDGLKETVRRECEERMEKMIEISELKEQLSQWARGGGARRSADATLQASVPVGQGGYNVEPVPARNSNTSNNVLVSSDELVAGSGGGDAAAGNASWALRMSRKDASTKNQFRNNSVRRK